MVMKCRSDATERRFSLSGWPKVEEMVRAIRLLCSYDYRIYRVKGLDNTLHDVFGMQV